MGVGIGRVTLMPHLQVCGTKPLIKTYGGGREGRSEEREMKKVGSYIKFQNVKN